jgi:hypothetical protein
VGFWARDYDQGVCNSLTVASKSFGESYVYVGGDNMLYIA